MDGDSMYPDSPVRRRTIVFAVAVVAYALLLVVTRGKFADASHAERVVQRVLLPFQASGYLPEDFEIEFHVDDMGMDARGVEALLVIVVNVGLWCLLLYGVAHLLTRSRPEKEPGG